MARVDLPSGGWVELRDASTVRVRDRKQVLLGAEKSGTGMASTIGAAEMVMALGVAAWSFDAPVPADELAVLDDLEIPDYDAIADALGDFQAALFPDFKAAGPKATSPA